MNDLLRKKKTDLELKGKLEQFRKSYKDTFGMEVKDEEIKAAFAEIFRKRSGSYIQDFFEGVSSMDLIRLEGMIKDKSKVRKK